RPLAEFGLVQRLRLLLDTRRVVLTHSWRQGGPPWAGAPDRSTWGNRAQAGGWPGGHCRRRGWRGARLIRNRFLEPSARRGQASLKRDGGRSQRSHSK